MFYQPSTAPMSYSSLYPHCPEKLLAHSTYLANTDWPKWKIKTYSRTNLQMHSFMSGIIRSTGSLHVFSTSAIMFLYPVICRKQAWRDSQPKVFKNRRKKRRGKWGKMRLILWHSFTWCMCNRTHWIYITFRKLLKQGLVNKSKISHWSSTWIVVELG